MIQDQTKTVASILADKQELSETIQMAIHKFCDANKGIVPGITIEHKFERFADGVRYRVASLVNIEIKL